MQILNNCILVTSLLLFSDHSFSQSNSDKAIYWKKLQQSKHDTSKALALIDYGGLFVYTNYDTAEFYYRQARDLSLKHNFFRGYQKYVSYQSEIFNLKGLFDSNLLMCRQGLAWAEKKNDFLFQGTHLNNIGNVYLYRTNNDSAGWYFLKASRCFERIKDSLRLGQTYSNLSIVFDNVGQYDQSLAYTRLALKIAKNTKDEVGIGYAMTNMGATFKKMKKFDSAEYYFRQALPIAQKAKDVHLEKDIVIDLGFVELKNKEYQKAYRFFNRGLVLSLQLQHDYGIIASQKGLASLKIEQKDFKAAGELLNQAIHLSKKNDFKEELQDLYLLQYEAAKAKGDFKTALEAYAGHIQIKDSLSNLSVQKNISALEKQYQAEHKERLILQKDNEIRSQQMQLQSKNTWLIILSLLVVLVGLIGFLVWKFYQQKRIAEAKEQKLLQVQLSMQAKEEERNRIARELHDDLGGSLSGIVVHTHFMIEQVEGDNKTEVRKSIDKIQNAASEMITKLNDIVWLINPKYDTVEKLVQRIEEYAIDMTRARGMQVKINTPGNIGDISLDTQARKNIYLICKEAINNAIKYSNATELTLNIIKSGNDLKLSVEDNGKGFDETIVKKGNGLLNMKERARNIGASYLLNATGSNGTKVQISYKIPQ